MAGNDYEKANWWTGAFVMFWVLMFSCIMTPLAFGDRDSFVINIGFFFGVCMAASYWMALHYLSK